MFKKTLLFSMLVPFMAQAVEITNNSSKTIHINCFNKESLRVKDVDYLAPNTSIVKHDVATIIANYDYNATQTIWQDEFRLENLTDESKVSFTGDRTTNSKILATVENNGKKIEIEPSSYFLY